MGKGEAGIFSNSRDALSREVRHIKTVGRPKIVGIFDFISGDTPPHWSTPVRAIQIRGPCRKLSASRPLENLNPQTALASLNTKYQKYWVAFLLTHKHIFSMLIDEKGNVLSSQL